MNYIKFMNSQEILKNMINDRIQNIKDAKLLIQFMTKDDQKVLLKDINILMDSAQDLYLTYIKDLDKGVFDRTIQDTIDGITMCHDNLKICKDDDIKHEIIHRFSGDTYITQSQQEKLKELKKQAIKFIEQMNRLNID